MMTEVIQDYRDKACKFAEKDCDTCEAMYWVNGKQWCCFDTVIRFIKFVNEHDI